MQVSSIITTIVICHFYSSVSGKLCPTKTHSLLDTASNDHITCPQLGEPSHYTGCCPRGSSRLCCPGNIQAALDLGLDVDDILNGDAAENIGRFVGIIISMVVFIFVATLLCCCCIPCCFCAKKRNLNRGGIVHSQAPGPVLPQSGVQTNYSSPSQYPTQQQGPCQYPPQHHQVPSPAQMQPYSDLPPPYPGPPVPIPGPGYPQMSTGQAPGYGDQGTVPDYMEKQPAFNPNMQ